MPLATCPGCAAFNELAPGHRFCPHCGNQAHVAPPGFAMSAPGEAPALEADRGKTLSIVATSFAGLGVAAFPGFGLVGLILGVITLARGAAPGSTAKALAIIAVVLGTVATLALAAMAWVMVRQGQSNLF